jgi:hypothetical protein
MPCVDYTTAQDQRNNLEIQVFKRQRELRLSPLRTSRSITTLVVDGSGLSRLPPDRFNISHSHKLRLQLMALGPWYLSIICWVPL